MVTVRRRAPYTNPIWIMQRGGDDAEISHPTSRVGVLTPEKFALNIIKLKDNGGLWPRRDERHATFKRF